MSTKNPIKVSQIIIHINSHLDEFLAVYLLRKYGEALFPGISNAAIRYTEANISGIDADYDQAEMLPVGCGGGRFDEHRPELERIEESATTLVANYLDLENRPELAKLIEEAFVCDTEGRTSPTMLAEIVKILNRAHRNNGDNAVLSWAFTMIEAIIYQEKYHFAKSANEKSLAEILRSQMAEGHYCENDKVRQQMIRLVQASDKFKDKSVTELAHITECLFRRGYNLERVTDWLDFVFSALNNDQLEFQELVDQIKKIKPIMIPFQNDKTKPLSLLVVNSDSSQSQKAARYCGAEVILLRKSNGNCQIFTDNRIAKLSLENVTRMIRWLELPIDKKSEATWLELGGPGEGNGLIKNWYYFKKAEMLFNGSETHKADPTKISTQALIDVLQNAFTFAGVRKWCNIRRIRMSEAPVAQKS